MIFQTKEIEEIIPIFKLYLSYMSQFYGIENVSAWQDKAVENLEKYVVHEDYLMFVLRKSYGIIGFAMVNRHLRFNTSGWAVAEFYIKKNHEKQGYGRRMAEHIFSQLPGNWEVAVSKQNASAQLFWKNVISAYTSGEFAEKRKSSIDEKGFLFNRGTA